MRYRLIPLLFVATVCAAAATSARAQTPDLASIAPDGDQQPSAPAPAHIELIDGVVTIEHQSQSDRAAMSQPLVAGDRVRTERGRVEVVFADGSFLYLDEFTSLEFLSESLLRLTMGRVTLIVRGQSDTTSASARYQIDTPAASVRTDVAGEYRISTLNGRGAPETELAVVRGAAQLATDAGAMIVRAGERTTALDAMAPRVPQPFNSARFDAFDRWIAARQDAWLGSTSTRYLPQDVQMYSGTFDRYGTWGADPQYGNVWYPTVAPTWRPYYNGYWDYYPGSYGWFWIGSDPWVWPTHHWGRWGYARSRWFWIPHRRWASAWVSWATSPGYVSWCPLGFDGRPVFGFFSGRAALRAGYDPWTAWTVMPRHRFGPRVHVTNAFIDGRRLASTQSTGFIVQRTGPQPPPRSRVLAVPRASPPAPTASTRSAGTPPSPDRRFERGVVDPRTSAAGLENRRGTQALGTAVPRGNATRIEPGEGGGPRTSTRGGWTAPQRQESPYDRAARVAAERRSGAGRQALPQGDTSYSSPYPPQYRSAVPEPFRPQRTNPDAEYGSRTGADRTVPRGSDRPHASPMIVAPPRGTRSYPGPYSPTVVQPRREGGPERGPGRSPDAAPSRREGGPERGPARSPDAAAASRGGDRGGDRGGRAAPQPAAPRETAQPRQGGAPSRRRP